MPGRRTKSRKTLRRRDGALCVSFANTCSQRRRAPYDYAELLAWLVRHGAFDAADAERLAAMAAESPGEAIAVFTFAQSARELLWRVFNELADRRKLSPELVEEVNSQLVEALPRQRIVPARNGFQWDWAFGSAEDLGQTLWPVIESAARVLTSKYVAKVVRCGGEGCDLLFLRRRGGSPRRWCSMKSCGKRVKSQRYYQGKVKPKKQMLKEQRRAQKKKFRKEWGPILAALEDPKS